MTVNVLGLFFKLSHECVVVRFEYFFFPAFGGPPESISALVMGHTLQNIPHAEIRLPLYEKRIAEIVKCGYILASKFQHVLLEAPMSKTPL